MAVTEPEQCFDTAVCVASIGQPGVAKDLADRFFNIVDTLTYVVPSAEILFEGLHNQFLRRLCRGLDAGARVDRISEFFILNRPYAYAERRRIQISSISFSDTLYDSNKIQINIRKVG